MTSTVDAPHVETLLANLRDVPVNTEAGSDSFLAPIFTYLMAVSPNRSDGVLHWFCDRAGQLTIDAATFLLRLFAYNSPQVDVWKKKLEFCLGGCCNCIKGLEEVKVSSKDTYFGAFSGEVLKGFYDSFNKWELSMVINALSHAGITSGIANNNPQPALSNVPPAVVYHMVSNLDILQDTRILSIIHTYPLSDSLPGWPTDPPPPGILILTMDEKAEVQQWAKSIISNCRVVPIPKEKFVGAYSIAMDAVAHAISTGTQTRNNSAMVTSSLNSTIIMAPGIFRNFPYSRDSANLWSGFCAFLRLVPPEMLTSNAHHNVDLRRLVTGHLHDTGPHFVDILRCLLFLLKRLGSNIWQGEGQEFPQVVFDAVKDNTSYSQLVQCIDPEGDRPWFLAWFPEFLQTLRDSPVYGDVLKKMVDFMCEELQHERFREARPTIMVASTKFLSSVIRKAQNENFRHSIAVTNVLDIHAEIFVSVAFARPYHDSKWKNARIAARELITSTLLKDIQDISAAIEQLCRLLAGRETLPPSCSIRKQIWAKSYTFLQTDDFDGIATIISIIARSSHLDTLNKKAFSPAFQRKEGSEATSSAEVAFEDINHSLLATRSGFLDVLSKYANYNLSTSILALLRRPGVGKDVTILMFSPVEDVQVAAQTLVGQAFDVDVRLDCFRALLENLPDCALDGIFDFLETFVQCSPMVPEACSLSKSLVRCLTDVIEVLCAGHNGLLHDDRFLKAVHKSETASPLPRLWTLMTKSITVIFKRTPLWSVYFENEDMIVWMRDALIFGRDMLAQRRVIESAAVVASEQYSSLEVSRRQGSSGFGKKMVNDLRDVLPELARWLRLTDEELLHQSFALLQSLLECFRESGIRPSTAGIGKLTKHIDDARKKDPSRLQTRLDSTRLSKLEDALAAFDDDDDDIQIISHTIPPPKQRDVGVKPSEARAKSSLAQTVLKQTTLAVGPKSTAITPQFPTARLTSKNISSRDQRTFKVTGSFPTFRKQEKLSLADAHKPPARQTVDKRIEAAGVARTEPTEESSSSDEESDQDEESQKGLAALGKFQRSPKVKRPVERRQVKMLDVPTKGKSSVNDRLNQRNDARRIALRLKPDISGLHRALLSWDYDHVGPEPPTSGEPPKLVRVPDRFSDHELYRSIFEPLLLLECWSQIVQSKDETQEICDCKISSRQFVDDWVDLDISISQSVPNGWYLADTDIVLLRHLDGKRSVLAKVRNYSAMPYGIQATLRSLLNRSKGDPGLLINSTWRLHKVFSLSTLHREYAALMALPYYDLYESILRPKSPPVPAINAKDVNQTMSTYNVNKPQALAILASLQAEGFALIQGPPGTGKTSTICGLVQTFISRRRRPVTSLHPGRNPGPMDREPQKKILLCAPSNAAIDEVAHRLKESRAGSSAIKVVRIGADKSINISVKDISLEFLVEQKLNGNQDQRTASRDASSETAGVRAEIEAVKRLKQDKQDELLTIRDNAARTLALEEEIKRLNSRRMTLTQQFDKLKDRTKNESRTLNATRRKYRMETLYEADVICSTLSGAGHESLEQFDFEMVIIDEAAQAIELSSLIPLKFRCKSCIMVGDPQQLPPTVLSQEACKFQYNQSLFVRLQRHHPDAVHLLSIQYRMHPDISQLPSHLFYQGRLQDGPDMAVKTQQPWHSHAKLGTYRFFNVSHGQEDATAGHSLKNKIECQVAVALYARIHQEFAKVDLDFRVGVVSMYSGQIMELRRSFEQRFGRDIVGKVHFSTVDGFQGQEKDIIILSCVRAGPGLQSVGFLSDIRRMNVALTRAKSSLFILGHAPTLERSDPNWRNIIQDARSRSCIADVDVTYFSSPGGTTSRNAPPPRRPPKSILPPTPALPMDLAKPRDLMAAINCASGESPRSQKPMENGTAQDNQSSHVAVHGVNRQGSQSGQKRPAMGHQITEASLSRVDKVRPGPPPAKRQKKDPTSIFIPKKHNKSAGPSDAKGRL